MVQTERIPLVDRGRDHEHARVGSRLRAAEGLVGGDWIAAIQAFAAGAILTMLSDEMIPEAFEYSDHNKIVGLAVALGFALSAALSFSD